MGERPDSARGRSDSLTERRRLGLPTADPSPSARPGRHARRRAVRGALIPGPGRSRPTLDGCRAGRQHGPRRSCPGRRRTRPRCYGASWESAEKLGRTATGTVEQSGFPAALVAVMGVFLVLQDSLDRRDPKLALAPLDDDEDLPFSAGVVR